MRPARPRVEVNPWFHFEKTPAPILDQSIMLGATLGAVAAPTNRLGQGEVESVAGHAATPLPARATDSANRRLSNGPGAASSNPI
jgi:hypothetical protein